MAKDDEGRKPVTIEVTPAQLEKMVADAVEARMAKQPAVAPAMSEDEKFHAEIASRKGTDKPALPTRTIHGVTLPSGATANVVVDHRGLVVRFDNYTKPEGFDRHQHDGGRVPNGHPIKGPLFDQHVYETYWQADINALVGKPLPQHLTPPAKAA